MPGGMSSLSVALCTFNGARYLEAQLNSIALQTRLPDEMIVADDCSTDATPGILRQFQQTAPFPVRLHQNERNQGSTKNFEHAIALCSGDLIALSDQDDVWRPGKLATLERALDQNAAAGLVFSDAELVDEELRPLGRRLWESTFSPADQGRFLRGRWLDVLVEYNVVTGATMVFRSRFKDVVLPFADLEGTIHDGWIALAIGVFSRLLFVPEPLVLYRQHGAQQIGVNLNPPPESRGFFDLGDDRRAQYYAKKRARLQEITAHFTRLKAKARAGGISGLSDDPSSDLDREIARLKDLGLHYAVRGELSPQRLQRLRPVVAELLARRYHRYSRGTLSAIKDLVR
jgi:glycosyltransferase involved in cell wall biosynthesis